MMPFYFALGYSRVVGCSPLDVPCEAESVILLGGLMLAFP
jgi:hypothetical protein